MSLKSWFWLHKWSSLVSTAFLLMLCLTGLPLIFGHEIDHALGHSVELPSLSEATTPPSIDEIVESAEFARPGEVVRFLVADADEKDMWSVSLGDSVDSAKTTSFLQYDGRTGVLLSDYPLTQTFMSTMVRLHVDMFLGLGGMLFLGAMGLLLLVAMVSGVALYAPFMKRRAFGEIRRSKSRHTRWLDIHNFLGIVTLVWFFAVGITGSLNTLSVPIFEHWKTTQLAEMRAGVASEQRPPIETRHVDAAVRAAKESHLDKDIHFIAFPGNSFATEHHFVAFMRGRSDISSQLLVPVMIDAESSEVVASRELPWYVQALLLSRPIHFGDYGGLLLKVMWALLDGLCIVMLVTGLYLWVVKNRRFEVWAKRWRNNL